MSDERYFISTINQEPKPMKEYKVRGFLRNQEVTDLFIFEALKPMAAVEEFLDFMAGDYDIIEVVGHGKYKVNKKIVWNIKRLK